MLRVSPVILIKLAVAVLASKILVKVQSVIINKSQVGFNQKKVPLPQQKKRQAKLCNWENLKNRMN